MKRSIRWHDFLTINIYWFALTTRSQVLSPLIIPLLVQQFVGEGAKGTYVGIIRLWSLMVAVLVQALMGLLSDRSTHRWGRRRPFILIGTLAELVIFAAIGLSAGLEGMTGYLGDLRALRPLDGGLEHGACGDAGADPGSGARR